MHICQWSHSEAREPSSVLEKKKKEEGKKKKKRGGCFADCTDLNFWGLSVKKRGQKKERDLSKGTQWGGWRGGDFTYHNSPNSEMHLALSEDLIIHPAAKQHSSTHADKGKSLLLLQTHHIV